MRVWNASQRPEVRSARATWAARVYAATVRSRLIARVKVLADTEDERIWMAFRYGKGALKSAKWRQRVTTQKAAA